MKSSIAPKYQTRKTALGIAWYLPLLHVHFGTVHAIRYRGAGSYRAVREAIVFD
jgi:hypothetical protein